MAEQLLLMADNLFSVTQYPNHTVTGQEEATGYEAYHVATGRRQSGDAWRPTTANADRYVRTRCDQLRGANCLIIDRNSNLLSNARAGNTSRVQLLGSNDNFTTYRTVLDVTLATVPGGVPSGGLGCLTDEDAWIKTFDADGFHDWQVVIKAMGSAITPSIGGVWLGMAWQPSDYQLAYPLEDEAHEVSFEETLTAFGWAGRSRVAGLRRGTLRIRPANDSDYDTLRWQILGLFKRGRSAWIVHNKSDRPERALLGRCPVGALAHVRDPSYHPLLRFLDIPFVEDQPA